MACCVFRSFRSFGCSWDGKFVLFCVRNVEANAPGVRLCVNDCVCVCV